MNDLHASDREQLTALLDGELDGAGADELIARLGENEALRVGLAELYGGGRSVAGGMERLGIAAPMDRLEQGLAGALAATGARRPAAPTAGRWGRAAPSIRAAALAALVLAGAIGLSAGYWMRGGGHEPAETWLQAVAEYWTLTTADTLALAPPAEFAQRELQGVAERLGLPLTMAAITLPDLSFRGATLFAFGGRPLTQIAYLDPTHGPIAYCLIADPSAGDTPPTATTMDGFQVVHWSSGGYGRMLIGHAPEETLRRHAEQLIAQSS